MYSTFRSLRGLFGLTIATAALLLALPAIAAADTFTVNDDDAPTDVGPGGTCGPRDHTTINDAVAVAGDGDVIRVCAGTYAESVESTPSVEFLGAQAGVDARTRSVPDAQESIVSVDDGDGIFVLGGIEAVVDGFTISGNPNGPAADPTDGAAIVNNLIADNDGGIFGDAQGVTIRRNRLADNGLGVGMQFADGAVVDENLFAGGHGFAAVALGLTDFAGENLTVTENETDADGGILVAGGVDVEIDRNVLTPGGDAEIPTIGLAADVNVDVTRNVVNNPPSATGAVTLFNFFEPNVFVDISHNTLLGDGDDAGIFAMEESYVETVDAHFNRIVGNEIGVFDAGNEGFIDATNNWWGCNEGPEDLDGGCDEVDSDSASIDFDPWLTLGAGADPSSIATGGETSDITADLLTNSDGENVGAGFPDGAQVDFATDLATIDPPFGLTQNGVAQTTLTSGSQAGTANVEATLDNETVATPVEITLQTEGCAERIDGTAGNDRLNGTEGSELIRGRAGRDTVNGLGADDCVKGGSGPDKVVGGPGEDRVRGGAGDDKAKARDGETDVVRCGAGDDVAKVDGGDQVRGCEEVKRG